jgi:hypothetical protein
VNEADHGRRPLLRACRKRPGRRRTPKRTNELPSSHSITSSARARREGGMVKPKIFAALMFYNKLEANDSESNANVLAFN